MRFYFRFADGSGTSGGRCENGQAARGKFIGAELEAPGTGDACAGGRFVIGSLAMQAEADQFQADHDSNPGSENAGSDLEFVTDGGCFAKEPIRMLARAFQRQIVW